MQCLCLSIDADEWNDRTELLSLCEFGTVPNFEENLRRENQSMRLTVMMRAAEGMNDYRKIRKKAYQLRLRPADTLARHWKSRAFIERATREAHANHRVVVSHHGCVREAMRAGTEADVLSAAYTSDCSDLLENVDLWVYGHTHESRDFTVGRTRIVSNSKGYGPWKPGEASDNPIFDPNYVIEI